jgi:hypothetical protein
VYLLTRLNTNTKQQDLVIQWGSHQSVFIQLLEAHVLQHGFSVGILSSDAYAGGYMYHHEKEKLAEVVAGKRTPVTFHMNWTQYKFEKIEYFRNATMWYTDEEVCGLEAIINATTVALEQQQEQQQEKENESVLGVSFDRCCVLPPALTVWDGVRAAREETQWASN